MPNQDASSRNAGQSRAVAVRAKVWLESDGEYAFGLGMSTILKAVRREGSIKGAAAAVGKSYRHIWTRIKETEQVLGTPLVHTTVGGREPRRSELTREGEILVREFDRLRQRVFRLVDRESASILQIVRESRTEPSR